jgi:nicotinamide-nucleotide amidase
MVRDAHRNTSRRAGAVTRPILAAEIVAVGSELTTGATRDTNSGDLARQLTELGVVVGRVSALPDDLELVTATFEAALTSADLVVSTGGLGPTPDDLTREAIAAACNAELRVDSEIEARLRDVFSRRGIEMPEANIKQAWLIPGAGALDNAGGTAPGWWVDRPDGRLIVALPGPPREMWPMWRDQVVPRLAERGIGADRAWHTLRLSGIGESQLVGLIGEELLAARNPAVATYVRADAVDVVVTAVSSTERPTAAELVEQVVGQLRRRVGRYVFAEGEQGWPESLGRLIGERRLAIVELGTAGQLSALLGAAPFLAFAELLRSPTAVDHAEVNLRHYAQRVRDMSGADLGLAVRATETAADTRVQVAIATEGAVEEIERTAFLGGAEGRRRAALAACAALWDFLGRSS